MAIKTYPLNDIDYQAEDAELFHCTRTSGVYASGHFPVSVTGTDNNITIGKGIGWLKNTEFSGKVFASKEETTLNAGVPDASLSRVDAVVVRFDANQNETYFTIKQGSTGSAPTPPEVERGEYIYELHLYHIRRSPGATAITPGDITDLRMDVNYCGLMADSVTQVDMSAINAQVREFIADWENQIANVTDGKMIESPEYPGCYYRMNHGVKEWLNPPMMEDVEYPTTKRQDGKRVYTKLLKARSQAGWVALEDVELIVSVFAVAERDWNGEKLMFQLPVDFLPEDTPTVQKMQVYYQGNHIRFESVVSKGMYNLYITVEYTKPGDEVAYTNVTADGDTLNVETNGDVSAQGDNLNVEMFTTVSADGGAYIRRLTINGVAYDLAVGQAGSGAPGTAYPGVPGQFYTDLDSGEVYVCMGGSADAGVYIWNTIIPPTLSTSGVRLNHKTGIESAYIAANQGAIVVSNSEKDAIVRGVANPVNANDVANKQYVDSKIGSGGTSVTITSITESTEDGGSNVVQFSDGKTLTVRNGKTGAPGGTPVKGQDYFTEEDVQGISDAVEKRQSYVTPEMYGAAGDGVTDDTEALRQCVESGKPVVLNGKYRITDVITAASQVDISGSGELYVANWRGLQLKSSGSIKGIGLVADSADCTNLVGFSDGENCIVENVSVSSNFTFDGHASCNMVTFTNCKNVTVDNIVMSDLRNIGNGTVSDSTGNMSGLYFHGCDNVSVNACKAENICNVDASGNIILEDSNAIYVHGESSVFTITNSHFRNAGKRHIKTQCGKSHVSNCYFYHDTEDLVVACGFGEAGDEVGEIYSVVDNCIFDIQVSKSGAYAISSSENMKCSNSYFFAKNYAVYLNGKHEYSNCHIEGVALLASTGNEQNFHDCYIAKIVNNASQTDVANLYSCKADYADGLINGYNTVFGFLRTRNLNDTELTFKECVIASTDHCLFQSKGRLVNCSVRNGKQVQIQNNCIIDGFHSENPESTISVVLRGSGKTITLKNVDLLENYFSYHTEAPAVVCYPAPTNGIPAVSHGFEGARIFNIQDYQYYVFESGAWLPAIEDSFPVSVHATFTQGDAVIYETATLDSLKPMLVVRLKYESGRNSVTTNYTLSGVLTGGTSTITVECEGLTTTFDVNVTEITNLVPFSIDTSGNVYNTTGYKTGYRFSSNGSESAYDGAICCGFIPIVSLDDAIRITGHDSATAMASGYNRVVLYDSAFAKVGHFDIQSTRAGCEVSTNANGTYEIKLVMSEYTGMTGTTDGAAYFRVCLGVCSDPSKFIITRNKAIA